MGLLKTGPFVGVYPVCIYVNILLADELQCRGFAVYAQHLGEADLTALVGLRAS